MCVQCDAGGGGRHQKQTQYLYKSAQEIYIMCKWCRQNGLILCLLYVDFPKVYRAVSEFSWLRLKIMIKIDLTKYLLLTLNINIH